MRRTGIALFALAALVLGTAASQHKTWSWDLPPGIAPPPVPGDNPMSKAKVELGHRLFYDADLSIDGTMSCATCHDQKRGFADGNRTRPGVHGDPGRRNVQGLGNVGYLAPLTWADSRLSTLEIQVAVPVFGDDPVEMGMKGKEAEIARRLSKDKCYRTMFRKAFPETGGSIDPPNVAKALAAFQRSMLSYNSPYDRAGRGEHGALSAEARRGKALFAANCASCHSGDNFSDGKFHTIPTGSPSSDAGLAHATGRAEDKGKFRTPGLRNASLTAPYFHDGSIASLEEAILRHASVVPAAGTLTASQRADLLALLDALTDRSFVSDPKFALPHEACGKPL